MSSAPASMGEREISGGAATAPDFRPRKYALLVVLFCMLCPPACGRLPSPGKQDAAPLPTATLMKQYQASVAASEAPPPAGRLTLERAVSEALTASPDLSQIEQRVNAAVEQLRQAEAGFYPRLIVAEDFNVTNNPVFALMDIINQRRLTSTIDFNHPGQQQNFSTRIQGEWSLFEGGSTWYNRKAAVNQRRSVEAELLAARNQLVAKVSETYYRWLQALGFIAVAERALESAQTDERLGEARLKAEMALPSEVARLKARRAEMQGNLVNAKTSSRRLQAGLERLIARPIGAGEIPEPGLTVPTGEASQAVGESTALVQQALDKRPEMAAVRALILAARERVRASRGGLLPRVGTNASYQLDSERLDGAAESWLVAVQATWALFEGGLTSAKISEARARLKEMEAHGKQVALDIALEVHQAALAVQEAAEKIHVAAERKQWSRQALEEVRRQYQNQVVTVDALLQAEVAWNQAEVGYTAALFEGKIAQALLRQSLGDFAEGIGAT